MLFYKPNQKVEVMRWINLFLKPNTTTSVPDVSKIIYVQERLIDGSSLPKFGTLSKK